MVNFVINIINLLPGVIGVVQAVLPLVKDIVVLAVRIIALLPLLWSVDQPIIDKVNVVYDKIYGAVEKLKNALLLLK